MEWVLTIKGITFMNYFSDTLEVWGDNWELKPANGYPTPPDVEHIKKVGVLTKGDISLELVQDSDLFQC